MLRRNPYVVGVVWVVASTIGCWLAGTLLTPPPPGVSDSRHTVLHGLFVEPAVFAALVAVPQAVVLWPFLRSRALTTSVFWAAVSTVMTWIAFFVALFAGFLGLVLVAIVARVFDVASGLAGQPSSPLDLGAAGLVLAAIPFLFGCVAAGLCIGAPQWLILRPHFRRACWWLPATVVGSFPLAPVIWATLYQEVALPGSWPGPLLGIGAGTGYGIVTGAVLAWLVAERARLEVG